MAPAQKILVVFRERSNGNLPVRTFKTTTRQRLGQLVVSSRELLETRQPNVFLPSHLRYGVRYLQEETRFSIIPKIVDYSTEEIFNCFHVFRFFGKILNY